VPAPLAGLGIDETGGYPGSAKLIKSIASMRAMVRAKKEDPNRFFAVWHTGQVSQPLAGLHHDAVDLLLLETYVARALPEKLGVEDIYQAIRDRLDPVVRAGDMLVPAYGSHCHALIGLDTSERPDLMTVAEQEQVVRFIRRICPEMRGLAHYNAGYGQYGLVRTAATDAQHEAFVRNADRLCLDYFVKPCLTFQRESLWVTQEEDETILTAALSNIGAIDAGPVLVYFYEDEERLCVVGAPSVPAGPNRNENRTLLRLPIESEPGMHTYRVEIVEAQNATVLDGEMAETRFLK
jgi:hypothetical protein